MNTDAKRIVDVVITRETSGVTSANFSTPLFLSATTAVATVVYTIMSLADVVSAGFTTTSAEYYAATAHFQQNGCPPTIKIAVGKTGSTITAILGEIVALDNDWYGLTISDITDPVDYQDAGIWCDLNYKFLFAASNNVAVIDNAVDTATTPALLNLSSVKNSMCIYNSKLRSAPDKSAGYADVAFAAMVLGRTIGTYTAFGKTLTGIIPDKFTGTQVTNMTTKHVTWYNNMYGKNITEGVKTCGGTESDWIDVEIGIDWLQTRIQEAVFSLVFSVDKIPYTVQGTEMLKSPVDGVLLLATNNKFLRDYKITTEDPLSQTSGDRANRTYNGLAFEADLAGAIHKTTINGKVRV